MSLRFRPVIRVFVSSTFSDLKEERNALQRDVFPRLEDYCLVRGFQFQAIDLRWGVPGEAGRDHRTMQICFEEQRRAQEVSPRPNFLVLLGDRYGWQPLAETISEAEFQTLERAAGELDADAAREAQASGSATEALRTWYRQDDNAVPVEYQLRSRSDWPGLPEWTEEDEEQAWKKVEQTLWAVINRAYPQEGLVGRFGQIPGADEPLPSIVKFQASATEQEIWRGALAVPDAPQHVIAWYRTIRNRDEYQHDPRATDFFDPNEVLRGPADDLRDELRRRLHRDGWPDIHPVDVDLQPSADGEKLEVTRDHLQPMCDEIEARLREIVDEEISAYWRPLGDVDAAAAPNQSGPSEARKLELETQAHQLFGESRAPRDGFVGRDAELKAIADYLRDENDRNPLVVHGPSGTGKTALLARASQIATEESKGRVLLRFLGTTPQSSNLNALLTSLCRELRPSEDRTNDLPVELRLLQEEFDRLLALATAEKPVLLFLDALDQLDEADGARQAYWLRTPLPQHVKVVVSCIRDDEGPAELNESYRSFERRKLLDRAIAVESLTAPDAIRAIGLWLQHDNRRPRRKRRLTEGQLGAIAARITPDSAAVCRRPLYLRILFEECRLWPSWKAVSADELGENTAALLEGLFDRLAQPAMHGALLVESVLCYIASARRGLSENEILEVLWADLDYRQHLDDVSRKSRHELPPEATRIPIAIWSRLRHDLDPYLAEQSAPGGVVLSFYHRVVGRVVAECFLKDAPRCCLRHSRLATYFQSERQPWWRKSDASRQVAEAAAFQRVPNARRATELPWQLLREADESDPNHEKPAVWDEPVALLCDLKFVELKCAAGLVFELQEDYRNTITALPEAQEGLRQERERQARLARWTEEITAYSRQWSVRRDQFARGELVCEPEPQLPEPPPTCCMWTEEEIEAECQRIVESPTRLDRIKAFAGFVEQECYPLQEFGALTGFVVQDAFNNTPRGPVHDAATLALSAVNVPLFLRHWSNTDRCNPRSALMRTLEGHTDKATCVSITPDGRRAVSGGGDTLRVWDLETGVCLCVLEGHQSTISSACVTPDGRHAVSGDWDGKLRVWNIDTGVCVWITEAHGRLVNSVSVTPDGRCAVSAGSDTMLRMWDLETGECLHVLKGHERAVFTVSVTPDGRHVVSAGEDGTCRLWDLETGACVRTLAQFRMMIESLSITPDGRRAVLAFQECKRLQVWDLETRKCLGELEGHTDWINSVSVTPDGRRAVSGSHDCTLRVWDMETRLCLGVLKGHKATVRGVGIIADGRRAITACEDNMTRVWNLETCAGLPLRDELKEPVLSVNMTPDGRRAVSTDGGMPANEMEPGIGYWNHTLRVLDLDSGVCSRVLEQHVKHRDRITMTPDSRLAISIREDGILRVWDLETGACLYTLKGDLDFVRSMSVTPDGRRAIFANRDHALHVWDLKAGTCLHIMKGHNHFVSCVSMTPDGRRAISVDNNMTCIWDLDKGKCLRARKRHNSACMTPDGRRAISAGSDKKLRVWDMETGASVNVIKGHTASVTSFWMAPDSRRAVLQSSTMSSDHRTVSDYTLRVFDLEAGVCLHVLKGHTASVTGVWVSPDSRRAVSASHDRTLRVWDLDSGVCLHMLKGHSRMIEDLWMKADGQSAVTMGFDSLRVWNLETGACLAVERVPAPVSCFDSSSVLDRVIIGASTGEVLRYDVLGIADTAVSQIP